MKITITADQIITGDDDNTIIRDGTIIIEDNRIDEIIADSHPSDADIDESFELEGHTLLPGIIDSHTHITYPGGDPNKQADLVTNTPSERAIRALGYARDTVNAGVTTIRDYGSPTDIAFAVRDATGDGDFIGPRIFAAGEGITTTGGHGDWVPWHVKRFLNVDGGAVGSKGRVADGPAQVLTAVREQIDRGADFIKVWASGGITDVDGGATVAFSQEELNILVEEADRQGVPVSAHAHFPESIKACVRAGVKSIEHGMFIDDEAIEMMARENVYLTPTISTMINLTTIESVASSVQQSATKAVDHQRSKLQKIVQEGVIITMGTDAGASALVHGNNTTELVHMVDAGLEPYKVIQSATKENAKKVGLTGELGLLKGGYLADIIAVEGDPLSDISILEDNNNIPLVVINGSVCKDTT